jgi:hypothetical protein
MSHSLRQNFHFLAMICTFLMYTHSRFDLNLLAINTPSQCNVLALDNVIRPYVKFLKLCLARECEGLVSALQRLVYSIPPVFQVRS